MFIEHLSAVRSTVGRAKIDVLTALFRNAIGQPATVPVWRFRADHVEWMRDLDQLEGAQLFLRRDQNGANYRLRFYALPLIEDAKAELLLNILGIAFVEMQKLYRDRLTVPVTLDEMLERLPCRGDEGIEALSYLSDAHAMWGGGSLAFPYGENPTICISESVLRYRDIGGIFNEFYEWHIVNPQMQVQVAKAAEGETRPSIFFGEDERVSRPTWYERLDDKRKALIDELDIAIGDDLRALPIMGLRTLIESTMLSYIHDLGSFKSNLNEFKRRGFLSEHDAALIDVVVDAGNAAVHRAHFPSKAALETCVEAVKHLLQGLELKCRIEDVAKQTPQRPK